MYGRVNCPYCIPYKETIDKYDPTIIDEYVECMDYREVVPRLTAFNLNGEVVAIERGVLDKNRLRAFLEFVKNETTKN